MFDWIFFILVGKEDNHKSLNLSQIHLGLQLSAIERLEISPVTRTTITPSIVVRVFIILADKQTWHNILCLNLGMIAVSSSELPYL